MAAYYNEIDEYAAKWLKNLIASGLIPAGDVDTRSVVDVVPEDLRGYDQAHFFAGIGGWAYALRLAGWPDDRPVWTGSCPCQPFSSAGKRGSFDDERHLWPAWFDLIEKCSPPVVLGEQVASKDGLAWLDLVSSDLEGEGYAFAALDICAASVGAPHIRQRIWFVGLADADHNGRRKHGIGLGSTPGAGEGGPQQRERIRPNPADGRAALRVGHPDGDGSPSGRAAAAAARHGDPAVAAGGARGLADVLGAGLERLARDGDGSREPGRVAPGPDGSIAAEGASGGVAGGGRPCTPDSFWGNPDWLFCRDGKWRPVEPGTFPLAHGLPAGMGKLCPGVRGLAEVAGLDAASLKRAKAYRIGALRGYGNAIAPELAAEFIRAVMGYQQ